MEYEQAPSTGAKFNWQQCKSTANQEQRHAPPSYTQVKLISAPTTPRMCRTAGRALPVSWEQSPP
eukprot:8973933-Lingulodinium_polyedra.AAC.1